MDIKGTAFIEVFDKQGNTIHKVNKNNTILIGYSNKLTNYIGYNQETFLKHCSVGSGNKQDTTQALYSLGIHNYTVPVDKVDDAIVLDTFVTTCVSYIPIQSSFTLTEIGIKEDINDEYVSYIHLGTYSFPVQAGYLIKVTYAYYYTGDDLRKTNRSIDHPINVNSIPGVKTYDLEYKFKDFKLGYTFFNSRDYYIIFEDDTREAVSRYGSASGLNISIDDRLPKDVKGFYIGNEDNYIKIIIHLSGNPRFRTEFVWEGFMDFQENSSINNLPIP